MIPHKTSVTATALIRKLNNHFTNWLYERKIQAFYCAVANESLRDGVQYLLQTVGLGKMHPNILLLGFNNMWLKQCATQIGSKANKQYEEYVGVIRLEKKFTYLIFNYIINNFSDAFESHLSVCVFRNENEGLDHSCNLSFFFEQVNNKIFSTIIRRRSCFCSFT